MNGKFIVIEGLEGAGKSSAISVCQQVLKAANIEFKNKVLSPLVYRYTVSSACYGLVSLGSSTFRLNLPFSHGESAAFVQSRCPALWVAVAYIGNDMLYLYLTYRMNLEARRTRSSSSLRHAYTKAHTRSHAWSIKSGLFDLCSALEKLVSKGLVWTQQK